MNPNFYQINGHIQKTEYSCVPMSVELILKLLQLMPINDFSLQNNANYIGNSDWIKNGFKYPYNAPKVEFSREFKLGDYGLNDRGKHFMETYFNNLFDVIDNELNNNRFVIISLESGVNTWHMEVIYNKIDFFNYETATCYYGQPNITILPNQDLRQRVAEMEGTDILTYKFI